MTIGPTEQRSRKVSNRIECRHSLVMLAVFVHHQRACGHSPSNEPPTPPDSLFSRPVSKCFPAAAATVAIQRRRCERPVLPTDRLCSRRSHRPNAETGVRRCAGDVNLGIHDPGSAASPWPGTLHIHAPYLCSLRAPFRSLCHAESIEFLAIRRQLRWGGFDLLPKALTN